MTPIKPKEAKIGDKARTIDSRNGVIAGVGLRTSPYILYVSVGDKIRGYLGWQLEWR